MIDYLIRRPSGENDFLFFLHWMSAGLGFMAIYIEAEVAGLILMRLYNEKGCEDGGI